jgi:histidinol-phosphatase (PHP family)
MLKSFKQNLHTHSTFCDGKNTPEEVVLGALEKGFDSIGFSSHSTTYGMISRGEPPTDLDGYKKEISRLKKKYNDKIKIYCGLEVDDSYKSDVTGFDYLLGSTHYLPFDDKFEGFDSRTPEQIQSLLDRRFNGNGLEFAKAYYHRLANLPSYAKFDIVAHFDLVVKHVENLPFVDIESKEYLALAFEAIEALKGKIPLFEVNVGGIVRGYRKSPYPYLSIVKELKRQGFGAVITTDCHNLDFLDTNMDKGVMLLKEAGFKEKFVLTDNGFIPIEL